MLFSSPILIQDVEDFYNPKGIPQTTSNEDEYVFEWNSTLGGIYNFRGYLYRWCPWSSS